LITYLIQKVKQGLVTDKHAFSKGGRPISTPGCMQIGRNYDDGCLQSMVGGQSNRLSM
jgi:hypothetical protein